MIDNDRYTDEALKRAILDRDQGAMAYAYDKYSGAVKTMAYRVGGSKFDMDEVLQCVFLKVFDKISMFDPDKGTLFTWIASVARYHAIDEMRRIASKEKNTSRLFTELKSDHFLDNIDRDECQYVELNIGKLIMTLKPMEINIIKFRYFSNMKLEDVASKLKIPVGTVKTTNHRIIRKLRKMLGVDESSGIRIKTV